MAPDDEAPREAAAAAAADEGPGAGGDDGGNSTIRFKSKKRKTLRQRTAAGPDDDAEKPSAPTADGSTIKTVVDATTAPATTQAQVAAPDQADEDHKTSNSHDDADADADADASAVQAALKLRQARNKHRFRRGGVGFGHDDAGAASDDAETSLVLRAGGGGDGPAVQGIPDRFMHQTGFVADAHDKHMMAYVESRLSSRATAETQVSASASSQQASPPRRQQDETMMAAAAAARISSVPATIQAGQSTTSWTKLVEVDVPADLRGSGSNDNKKNHNNHNHNGNALHSGRKRGLEAGTGDKTKQPPTGRRRRNRRGSDDIKRDEMVEAFLHENRLDVYDHPSPSNNTSTGAAAATTIPSGTVPGRSADDALAESFRQQYYEEVAARRQRHRPAINQPRVSQKQQQHQQAVAAGEVLRGPKLGGSRNARAAVRDALLQQQELGKKK